MMEQNKQKQYADGASRAGGAGGGMSDGGGVDSAATDVTPASASAADASASASAPSSLASASAAFEVMIRNVESLCVGNLLDPDLDNNNNSSSSSNNNSNHPNIRPNDENIAKTMMKKVIKVRLLCLPWAGGSSTLFSPWRRRRTTRTRTMRRNDKKTKNTHSNKKMDDGNSSSSSRDDDDVVVVLEDEKDDNNTWKSRTTVHQAAAAAGVGDSTDPSGDIDIEIEIDVRPFDYPGRFIRSEEEPKTDLLELVEYIYRHEFQFESTSQSSSSDGYYYSDFKSNEQVAEYDYLAIFGHSFGAILAYELARKYEHQQQQQQKQRRQPPLLGVFVSAMKSPSSYIISPKTNPTNPHCIDEKVSEMSLKQLRNYFERKGNPIDDTLLTTSGDELEYFIKIIRADYKCLETYQVRPLVSSLSHNNSNMNLNMKKKDGGDFGNNNASGEIAQAPPAATTTAIILAEGTDENGASNDDDGNIEQQRISIRQFYKLSCPIYSYGGTLDPGVTLQDVEDWSNFSSYNDNSSSRSSTEVDIDLKKNKNSSVLSSSYSGSGSTTSSTTTTTRIFQGQGHFYLNDPVTMKQLGTDVANHIRRRVLQLLLLEQQENRRNITNLLPSNQSLHSTNSFTPTLRHDEHYDYWSETMDGLQPIDLPLDYQRPGVPAATAATSLSSPSENYKTSKYYHQIPFEVDEQDFRKFRNLLKNHQKRLQSLISSSSSTTTISASLSAFLFSSWTMMPGGTTYDENDDDSSSWPLLLEMGLLTAYACLLHRWGGGDVNDFAIGILDKLDSKQSHTIATNTATRTSSMIRTAVRVDFDEAVHLNEYGDDETADHNEPSFLDMLHRISQSYAQSVRHVADTPTKTNDGPSTFERYAHVLRFSRSCCQAIFRMLDEEISVVSAPRTSFEICFQFVRGSRRGSLSLAKDHFSLSTGRRMVEGFSKLIEAIGSIGSERIPISSYRITPDADLALAHECNQTDVKYDESTSLVDRIMTIDRKMIAFLCDRDDDAPVEQSFGEFQDNVRRVSKYLQGVASIKRKERVGILMRSSPQAIATIFGVVMAGGIVVVLDIDKTPVDRIEITFEDSQVTTYIVDTIHDSKVQEIGHKSSSKYNCVPWQLFSLQKTPLTNNYKQETFRCDSALLNDEEVFGLFYTSGTTGAPKGAVVTMKNVINLTNWWIDFFSVTSQDRILLFSSLSFIMSLRQYVPTLCAGGAVAIPKSAIDFEDAVIKCGVNKLVCTPSALATLDVSRMGNIRSVQVAGEAPQRSTVLKWNEIVQDFFIGLGPTELCAHALCSKFDGETICIGHPARNVRSYIVESRSGEQVPVNCVGELWVAGKNVTKGYLNREELTNKHFTLDPFRKDGLRMYKTGDLAKRLPDGRIQFVGRRDLQIKVNGFRVEPGDIIRHCPPEVHSARVLLQDGALALYVTPATVSKTEILSKMKVELPTYMVPRIVVCLENFPLNKNKKVDMKALLEMGAAALEEERKSEKERRSKGPMSELERRVQAVWSSILHIDSDELDVNDSFFEKGGTSLLAVIMSRTLSRELGINISIQEIFAHQSIKEQAALAAEMTQPQVGSRAGDPLSLDFIPGGSKVMNPFLFGFCQTIGIILMTFIVVIPVIALIYFGSRMFAWFGYGYGFLAFPPFLVAACLFHMLLVTICKWLIIGKYREGKCKLYSWFFLKWWLVRRIIYVSRLYTWSLDQTVFLRYWFMVLGGHVGKDFSAESIFALEPDLIDIGDGVVVGFETQFNTTEVMHNGLVEFRKIQVEDHSKIGVRAVLMGGVRIRKGCHVLAKSSVDTGFDCRSDNQIIGGSPAIVRGEIRDVAKRIQHHLFFSVLQMMALFCIILLIETVALAGYSIGFVVQERYGITGLVLYIGTCFLAIIGILFSLLVAVLYRALIKIEARRTYKGKWFEIKKWFLDRLLLSPLFSYASERILQASSTYPWYLKLLGAKVRRRTWIRNPYIRVGVELLEIGNDTHMGMQNYITTEIESVNGQEGYRFDSVYIGDSVSIGQRVVILGGAQLLRQATVGAETLISEYYVVNEGGTTFGSPPVAFTSTLTHTEIIEQTQKGAARITMGRRLSTRSLNVNDLKRLSISGRSSKNLSSSMKSDKRFLDKSEPKMALPLPSATTSSKSCCSFWLYAFAQLFLQCLMPAIVICCYVGMFFAMDAIFAPLLSYYLAVCISVPLTYLLGSFAVMLILKIMQLGGGKIRVGTADFFSWKFFYWHVQADMTYLSTSTALYPFSGTALYVWWLQFMRVKVKSGGKGNNVWVSPEHGGFRELDSFLEIGSNAVVMTPHISAHYIDRGLLQFCPVRLQSGVVINQGATVQPLTEYRDKCCLRPFAVTIKGQALAENTSYFGNPCKPTPRAFSCYSRP